MTTPNEARQLAQLLAERDLMIVFAESCTAGLAAATLAQVPGVSAHLCGSVVTYRPTTKHVWLDVSEDDLQQYTAESEPVARQMALGVLRNTPEADLAVSITGHLGPGAPPAADGIVYIGVAWRRDAHSYSGSVTRHSLSATERSARQHEAALFVLHSAIETINARG